MKNRLDIPTPEGFVITSAGYETFLSANDLQAEIDSRFQAAETDNIAKLYELSSDVQQLILRAEVPEALRSGIYQAVTRLETNIQGKATLALRSSALGEDTPETSFAGQYRSILNVGVDSILEAYKEVVASKYALQAISYRLNRGFRDEDVAMCVGCMEMVDAHAGGVMYSCSPVDDNDDAIFINAAWGLPKTVVDGSGACDLFVVTRNKPMQIRHAEISVKERQFVCFPEEGICRMELTGDMQTQPAITEDQALQLAETAVKIETHYAGPQDIEWAVSRDGAIYILQCRPLQQVKGSRRSRPAAITEKHPVLVEAKGITASPGTASGKVFPVHKSMDILSFPEGAVLVVRQALPIWASLLSRAAAVVTEQGGFAGHLANVAREFGVPAIFSVPGALERLHAGDEITIDADNLMIYEGKVASLLAGTAPRENLMAGSPIYTVLQHVSQYMIPLNLLDPASPEFRPRNCMTMHDITRFAHEKSVSEMFNFGKTHDFSERSSKQLYHHVPMQWWILNLDDGFKEEVTGKYVTLENICSLPMLAFWEGYAAVAWEGPPPIDGKGLLSVMFGSTMNPALTSGVRSRFADRNYFMISKNYCSLSSRLGYHFSTLEALVSERASENYVSFQFKGGAADNDRRIKRVYFIQEILSTYGFRVDVREDNLIARVEGDDDTFMRDRLKILGYLSLHTRQLDMIMANLSAVQHYQAKLHSDIQALFAEKDEINA
jgi:pyruvate,water dikinase